MLLLLILPSLSLSLWFISSPHPLSFSLFVHTHKERMMEIIPCTSLSKGFPNTCIGLKASLSSLAIKKPKESMFICSRVMFLDKSGPCSPFSNHVNMEYRNNISMMRKLLKGSQYFPHNAKLKQPQLDTLHNSSRS